jgi:1-aminocyclopropane-1-carboxylate deaminase
MSSLSDATFIDQFGQIPFNTPTPLQLIHDAVVEAAGILLYIKREDVIHPQISGNKCRKLKYNLLEAKKRGKDTLLTFGGAYSNHIHAVAAAGEVFGLRTIGLIRGQETLPLNTTLTFAKACGMEIHYLNRTDYRSKNTPDFIQSLTAEFGDFYLLPEGGSNALAVKGCAEIMEEITIPFDYICCACGTGATLAGLIAALKSHQKAVGFSALKGGGFLYRDVAALLESYYLLSTDNPNKITLSSNWEINLNYHFGGYAKTTAGLFDFIHTFEEMHHIPLEQIYTGKMIYGIYDLIKKGYFRKGDSIIAIHTGGLPGRSDLI